MQVPAVRLGETLANVFRFHAAFNLVNTDKPALPFHDDPELNMELTVAAQTIAQVSKRLRVYADANADVGKNLLAMRAHLMTEELAETIEAMAAGDHLKVLDGFADQRYVQDGSILALGYARGFLTAFREVHSSNMTKLGPDGKPVLSEGGRVIKGPNYRPANLYPALAECHLGLFTRDVA